MTQEELQALWNSGANQQPTAPTTQEDLQALWNSPEARNVNDDDGMFGESIDIAQSSGLKQLSDIYNVAEKASQSDFMKPITEGYNKFARGVEEYFGGDQKLGVLSDEGEDFLGTGASYQELRDPAAQGLRDQLTGVKPETREKINADMAKAQEDWAQGNYESSIGSVIPNLPYLLAESAPEMATLMAGAPGFATVVGTRLSNQSEEFERNNGRPMEFGEMVQTAGNIAATMAAEKMLVKTGISNTIGKGANKLGLGGRAGGIAGAAAGEAAQEYAEGIQETYDTQRIGDRTLGEIMTDPNQAFQGAVGGLMGGSLAGTGVAGKYGMEAGRAGLDVARDKTLKSLYDLNQQYNAEQDAKAEVVADIERSGLDALTKEGFDRLSAEEKIKIAEDKGVKVFTTDVIKPENITTQQMQKLSERVLAGMSGPRNVQSEGVVNNLVSWLADMGADQEPAIIQEEIVNNLNKFRNNKIDKFHNQKINIFNKISGNPIDISKTISKIENEIAEYERKGGLFKEFLPVLKQGLDSFKKSGDITDVEASRKQFGAKLKDRNNITNTDEGQKALNRIYKVLSEDIGAYVTKYGDKNDYKKWKEANEELHSMHTEVKGSAVLNVIKKGEANPTLINGILKKDNIKDIKKLYKNLDKEGRKHLKAALISIVVNEKAQGKDPKSFMKNAFKNKYKLEQILSKSEQEALNGLIILIKTAERSQDANTQINTGDQASTYIAPVVAGAVGFYAGGPIAAALMSLGAGYASRLFESKAIRNGLIKLGKMNGRMQESYARIVHNQIQKAIKILEADQAKREAQISQIAAEKEAYQNRPGMRQKVGDFLDDIENEANKAAGGGTPPLIPSYDNKEYLLNKLGLDKFKAKVLVSRGEADSEIRDRIISSSDKVIKDIMEDPYLDRKTFNGIIRLRGGKIPLYTNLKFLDNIDWDSIEDTNLTELVDGLYNKQELVKELVRTGPGRGREAVIRYIRGGQYPLSTEIDELINLKEKAKQAQSKNTIELEVQNLKEVLSNAEVSGFVKRAIEHAKSKDKLIQIYKSSWDSIGADEKYELAKKTNDSDILQAIYEKEGLDGDYEVLGEVISNKNTPESIVNELIDDENMNVIQYFKLHENLSEETIENLFDGLGYEFEEEIKDHKNAKDYMKKFYEYREDGSDEIKLWEAKEKFGGNKQAQSKNTVELTNKNNNTGYNEDMNIQKDGIKKIGDPITISKSNGNMSIEAQKLDNNDHPVFTEMEYNLNYKNGENRKLYVLYNKIAKNYIVKSEPTDDVLIDPSNNTDRTREFDIELENDAAFDSFINNVKLLTPEAFDSREFDKIQNINPFEKKVFESKINNKNNIVEKAEKKAPETEVERIKAEYDRIHDIALKKKRADRKADITEEMNMLKKLEKQKKEAIENAKL